MPLSRFLCPLTGNHHFLSTLCQWTLPSLDPFSPPDLVLKLQVTQSLVTTIPIAATINPVGHFPYPETHMTLDHVPSQSTLTLLLHQLLTLAIRGPGSINVFPESGLSGLSSQTMREGSWVTAYTVGASIVDQLRPQRGAALLSAQENWYVFVTSNISFLTVSQLCNRCGLFERTHHVPRPEKFPRRRQARPASAFPIPAFSGEQWQCQNRLPSTVLPTQSFRHLDAVDGQSIPQSLSWMTQDEASPSPSPVTGGQRYPTSHWHQQTMYRGDSQI
jgi:hypothetical protein